ncbi:N-acetyltransferase [Vibrio mytili]|uniref:Acetyltransferase n=1 Tax=Vibrio mytili TaxID=50718 RepID=A0A0C3EBZ1_9VIBR|nr:N-acetyltransferase [Vibrio mytili]KIN11953.1 acetyltransferase [Vibrio mytili]
MTIQPATKDDLFAVFTLENTLFGEHAYPQFFFRQAFDCWGESLLVAKDCDQVAGYLLLTTSSDHNQYWIMSLAVSTQHQGKGVARSLIRRAIEPLPKGAKVSLTVEPNNQAARTLYLSLGFEIVSEEVNYFGDEESRLVMELIK